MPNWTLSFQGLLNIFLKSNCPLCQRPTAQEFCQDCKRQLQGCQIADKSQFWQGELPMFAWGLYAGALKRSIATLKYENQPKLAQPLGQWLGEAWLKSSLSRPNLIVVPIPLHPTKQQKRGYNQAQLLAQSFCDLTGLSLQNNALERVRATEAQFGLSVTGRKQNLAGAFKVGKGFIHKTPVKAVLLLDDIYTSGATAKAAKFALNEQGIEVYGIVAIATPRK